MSNNLFYLKGNSNPNHKTGNKQKRTVFMLLMVSFLFFVGVSGQQAQNSVSLSVYDSLSRAWSNAPSPNGSTGIVTDGAGGFWVSIDGPAYVDGDADWVWEITMSGGTWPYSYEWYFDGVDYNYQLMSTDSYVELEGRFDNDVTIHLKVTDGAGRVAWASLDVIAGRNPN